MSPDQRSRKRRTNPGRSQQVLRTRPSSDDAHDVVYFKRHHADDSSDAVPGQEFLAGCPTKVRATMRAVLVAVAAAPPKRYSGGGYWEAMKGDMTGWFEVRVDGPDVITTGCSAVWTTMLMAGDSLRWRSSAGWTSRPDAALRCRLQARPGPR